ncbi:MAG: PEGA domain-containing protein [Candidatus Aenigmarchaeota archaeon]
MVLEDEENFLNDLENELRRIWRELQARRRRPQRQTMPGSRRGAMPPGGGAGGAGGGAGTAGGATGRETVTLKVVVMSDKGKPINDAVIHIYGVTPADGWKLVGNTGTYATLLQEGTYVMRCIMKGYEDDEKTVTLKKGTQTIKFTLKRSKVKVTVEGMASIYFKVLDSRTGRRVPAFTYKSDAPVGTNSAGDSIYEKTVGAGVSEASLQDIEPGKHWIRVSKADYKTQQQEIEVDEDEAKTDVVFKLVKLKAKEKLEKELKPPVSYALKDKLKSPTGPIVYILIGAIILGVLQSGFIFAAFILWAVYSLIPAPHTLDHIVDRLKALNKKLEIETDKEEIEKIESSINALKGEVDIMKLIEKESAAMSGTVIGVSIGRQVLKMLGILVLGWGIVSLPLPMAVLVGIIILIVGYMGMGGDRAEKSVKKD